MSLVTPAILASSRADFEEKLARYVPVKGAKRLQLDVVDGRFAGPVSWPLNVRGAFARDDLLPHLDRFQYEIDLMVLEPEQVAQVFLEAGASRLVLHAESTANLGRLLAIIRRASGHEKDFIPGLLSIGLALNSASDVRLIEPYLDQVDFIQCMGIAKIGAQRQPFAPRVLEQIRVLRSRHPEMPIQVDGGITLETAPELLTLGVSTLVVGHALLDAANVAQELQRFEDLASQYGV